MNKQYNYTNIIKETLILTVAVGIIGAAVYFFLCPVILLLVVFQDWVLYYLILYHYHCLPSP